MLKIVTQLDTSPDLCSDGSGKCWHCSLMSCLLALAWWFFRKGKTVGLVQFSLWSSVFFSFLPTFSVPFHGQKQAQHFQERKCVPVSLFSDDYGIPPPPTSVTAVFHTVIKWSANKFIISTRGVVSLRAVSEASHHGLYLGPTVFFLKAFEVLIVCCGGHC